ncbi:hypothetical protein FUA48_01925 [Flavobacterium alkalisoli]|uniref:SusE outer membrane protein domain-containing protein n=1 Tax=Flavobacterium alkalisoli TaxID=2602769 RepID=A0A5B9FN18_9FLAO|nr:SusE domain-containing protein [Flavobacterium alkalisoli]QEE48374.1 hypothetical protein FUA48_01925 [Flavobacterium alkalisoli]
MKKIFSFSVLALLFMSIMSCSSDDDITVVQSDSAPVLISPEDGTSIELTQELADNPALTLVWDHSVYSVDTQIDYTIEMAVSGTEFAAPQTVGTTSTHVYSMSVVELNTVAVGLGLTPFEEGSIDIRVTSSLGDNADLAMTSNTITINVTPYENIEPQDPVLFFVGAPQAYYGLNAWDNTTAIPMRYIGDGTTLVFEAYVKVGSADGFKFIGQQGSWDNGNYGTIGGAQDGNLENSGGSSDIKVAETDGDGLYYVWVDIDNLEYKSVKMDWGIIGSATANGWDGETAMTYDFDSNSYSIAATLTEGEMKFRSSNTGNFIAGDAWKFNVGNSDPMVTYNPGAPNFAVSAGSYNIDFSLDFTGTATVSGL